MPWCGGISTAKLFRSSTVAMDLPVNMSDTDPAGWQLLRSHRAGDFLVGEVEDGELVSPCIRELVDQHQHAAVRHLGYVDLVGWSRSRSASAP